MTTGEVATAGLEVARRLERGGIRRAYTVPGESALDLLDALEHETSVRVISTRTESGAAFMAEAEGKLTGHPALAMAGRAVGATNLSLGVYTARYDSTPMLVILGQVTSNLLGRDSFQEIDLVAFYRPIAKWIVDAVHANRLPRAIDRALEVARAGRPGPAVLAVPGDLFGERIAVEGAPPPSAPPRPSARPEDLLVVRQLLEQAVQPVAIVGGGAREAKDLVVAFAEQFGVGCYTAFRRQDSFPNDHPNYLGHLAIGTPAAVLEAIQRADVVVALGTRLSEITTQRYALPPSEAKLIHIDLEPGGVGSSVAAHLAIQADTGATLTGLLATAGDPLARDWSAARAVYLASMQVASQSSSGTTIDPADAMRALAAALPADAIVTNDAGNFTAFAHRQISFVDGARQLGPTSGAMGYAVPAAIGAKLAAPERPAIALAGDGGFLMTGQEIETGRRCGAPIVCVVFQNGKYGTIESHQRAQFGRVSAVEIGDLDLSRYAEALGCRGYTVERADDLGPAIDDALASDLPCVIDVRTDPDVLLPGPGV